MAIRRLIDLPHYDTIIRVPHHEITLPVTGDYHLGQTLSLLTMGRGNPCLRHNETQGQLTLNTPRGPVALAATRSGETLRVVVTGSAAEWIEPLLPGLFGLEDDLTGFAPEGRLGRIADELAGLRLPRLPAVFDRLVQIVLQQLIQFRDACRGWRLLVHRYGEEVPHSGGLYYAPTAETLAGLAVYQLMECDILPKHARVILTLAKQAAALERLWESGADPAARERLCEHLLRQPGVGPWTVGYLRGAGLGDADALVLGDYGHPHHVAYFFTGKERSDDDEMQQLLAPYAPHRYRVLSLLILGTPPPPRRGPRRASQRDRFR
ncbi:DNA-3-methyladenine glycosylase family protein [Botrimarina hoheduenensis]|uniref:DNA-3-methyladenine glycosylase n=1 Tax=Botrimarina hoheduenensis TaxID=2528000 RepID=A0A5C5VZJ4_9BACT|nr:hypothetical protein [Botrimarina hoheduenensis]TWT43393.1 DNA-3-methyladenine glycosylase [Botrimarina hoheduenensis]